MARRLLHLHLLFLFSAAAVSLSTADGDDTNPQCNERDRDVLLKIKKDLGDPYGIIQWTPHGNCCEWPGVTCNDSTGRVTGVLVTDDVVAGHISPAVGDLPYLKTLWFRKLTNLTGPIPPTITKLKLLTSVRISWTYLACPFPPFFADVKSLEYLDLSFNNFTGPIPPSLATLPKLDYLNLGRNHLTGPIPPTFGSFPSPTLDSIILAHNQLTGPIPSSMGDLKLRVLDLNRNQLEGDAIFVFKASSTVETIDISKNKLAFDFSKAKFGKKLIWLLMDHNKIYGELPKAIAKVGLQNFNASYNQLCGPIPQGENWTDRFGKYSFFHNQCLCGKPLDPCK